MKDLCFVIYNSVVIIVVIMLCVQEGQGANILFVAPFPALSHYQMLEPLFLKLAEREHNVTVLSHYSQKEKILNYTDVDLKGLFPPYELDFKFWGTFEDALDLFAYGSKNCEIFSSSDKVQNFLKSDNKFDLIFIEAFDSECLLGFVAKYNAPYILYSAMGLPSWESDWIYNPTEATYFPDNLCRLGGNMNFFNRLQNLGCVLLFRTLNRYYNREVRTEMIKKHFHVNVDSLEELKRNVSFIFVNSFHGVTGVRPLLPNVLEVGGLHLKAPSTLPEKFQKFFEESVGMIVISMGSIIKSSTLSPTIKKGFLTVISKLNERVLWKWEEEFQNKPENLMTVTWLPQFDILSHPKMKIFISHGGIHGLYEAIYNGIPIIGIPLFGDQIGNLKTLELRGVAIVIDFADLNEKTLSSAISRMLSNDSYSKNAKLLSRVFRDQPQTPLERAVFWTEYVLRHKGAFHFQTGASQLLWFQYYLIDVILLCIISFTLLVFVFYYSMKFLKLCDFIKFLCQKIKSSFF